TEVIILDGPVCNDRYVWWNIQADGDRGWSVEYVNGNRALSPEVPVDWPPSNRYEYPANGVLLSGGRGLTNGASQNNGNFQVEGYCSYIGGQVREDGRNWYCGSRQLTISDFDEICRRTYNNSQAAAFLTGNSGYAAYNWRCYGPR
ncbi:MAG: hypothetical protein CUN55_00160, partial [Phototrophicales bacterium]